MTDADRNTQPGALLKGYERLKAKIGGLIGRGGTVPAGQDWKTAGNEDTPDAVRSQEEMKSAFGRGDAGGTDAGTGAGTGASATPETAVYEEVAAQAARADRADAEADAQAETDREAERERAGQVEIEGPDLRADARSAAGGAARRDGSPSLTDLDRRALDGLARDDLTGEAEVGRVPDDGMGLDDAPRDARGDGL